MWDFLKPESEGSSDGESFVCQIEQHLGQMLQPAGSLLLSGTSSRTCEFFSDFLVGGHAGHVLRGSLALDMINV